MDKSDLKEIRKVVKSKDTVVDWIYGVYVNADNVPVWENVEKLIGMEEAEQFRYQTLFSKALSTRLGRDSFPIQMESQNEELLALRKMKGLSVSEFTGFRDSLLAGYAHTDPYYATLTKIVYDVPTKSKDGRKLEDGDLVYQALLFAISPAKLTQPALGFDEDRVTELDRRWQIGNPVSSFLYPAFDGRLENRNEVLVHSAAPDEEDFINGLDDPKDAMFEFEFLMDGRKVSSILIDGSIYPRFVRKNIDLTNSKNRYRSENVYAPLECYIVDQFRTECSDVTRELIDVLCSCCCHDNPESYHTKTTFGGMSTPIDIFVEHQDFRYIKKLEAILTRKTRRYMKELYY